MPRFENSERTKAAVTGIVLAGGRGQRMGGVDKGLAPMGSHTMVELVIARFAPQVDELLIIANRNLERYRGFGHRVLSDAIADFAGPLAGLHRGMLDAANELVCTVPCDSPFLPTDLVDRLRQPVVDGDDLAVATTGGRQQPVFCLARRSLLPGLEHYLASGERRFGGWYAGLKVAAVPFDDDTAFVNINTEADLRALDRPR